MIQEYDQLFGVPSGHYYLIKELSGFKEILMTATTKAELISICVVNGWDCDSTPRGIGVPRTQTSPRHKIKQNEYKPWKPW